MIRPRRSENFLYHIVLKLRSYLKLNDLFITSRNKSFVIYYSSWLFCSNFGCNSLKKSIVEIYCWNEEQE